MTDRKGLVAIFGDAREMFTLSADRKFIRMTVPGLPVAGLREPLKVSVDFDARALDAMLERLTILRAQMLPVLPKPGERN